MLLRRMMRHLLPKALSLRLRREWLGRRIVSGRAYFESDVPLLKIYVKQTDICWDIGANTGTYTLHLSRLASQVFAFEPVPHNVEILQDVKRRGHLDNVVVSRLALSDDVGHSRMTIPVEGFYGGFYLAQLNEAGELDVETSTIDALIASGVPDPDFIKCDVEGAEARVLDGACDLLKRCRPIWLLETFEDGIVERLRSYGYSAHVRDDNGQLIEVQRRVHERNYWFFPTK